MSIHIKKATGGTKVDNEHLFGELIDILKREIQSFNKIIELLILEQKGLVECDNGLLIEVLENQGDVLSSIACLEKSRIGVVARIAEHFGEDPETLTVTRLSKFAGETIRKQLLDIAHVLSTINEDIRYKKISNTLLINQGIVLVVNQIRFILKALGKEEMIRDIYSPEAGAVSFSGSISLDSRI